MSTTNLISRQIISRMKAALDVSTDLELAKHLGYSSTGTISRWKAKDASVPISAIEKVASTTGKTIDEIKRSNTETAGLLPSNTIFIPLFNVEASAGGGSLVEEECIVDRIAFKEDWIRNDLGVNPKDLALITTIGDSMEPTLRAGDMVLLDRSVEKIKDEAIYAMSVDGMLLIKRVRWRADGGLTLLSDNQDYEAVVIAPDMKAALRVVGRLMWAGRRL